MKIHLEGVGKNTEVSGKAHCIGVKAHPIRYKTHTKNLRYFTPYKVFQMGQT